MADFPTCFCIQSALTHCFGGSIWRKSSLTQKCNWKSEVNLNGFFRWLWMALCHNTKATSGRSFTISGDTRLKLCQWSLFPFPFSVYLALGKDLCPCMTHPQLSKADSLHHTLPKKPHITTATDLIRQVCKYWELSAHSSGYKFWRILISEWKLNHTTANTLNHFP